jgi:tripartite-type tricarboxylate transporter receptor subunit TctC
MDEDSVLHAITRHWVAAALAAATCTAPVVTAHAQEFPSENMRLIVNVAAGGATDAIARLVAHGLYEKWGKPVIVENLVGGHSALAAQAVIRAKADGHTLFVTADAPFTSTPLLVKKLSFGLSQFTPIAMICRPAPVFAVKASLGVKTMTEFIALAQSRAGKLNYASQGLGTYGHLGMEDFKRKTGTDIVHVPYRGGAPALEGLVRGDVDALIINYANVAPFVESGRAVMVAAAGDRRSAIQPDIPTAIEQGVPFSVSTWFGMFGPAQMSPDLLARIRSGVEAVLESEAAAEFFKLNSCERMKATPAQFGDIIAADHKHWGAVINASGIQID